MPKEEERRCFQKNNDLSNECCDDNLRRSKSGRDRGMRFKPKIAGMTQREQNVLRAGGGEVERGKDRRMGVGGWRARQMTNCD